MAAQQIMIGTLMAALLATALPALAGEISPAAVVATGSARGAAGASAPLSIAVYAGGRQLRDQLLAADAAAATPRAPVARAAARR